jgi:hypothetical protein
MEPRPPHFNATALLASLHQHRVDHVVIGALAARLHGSIRPTSNADIVPDRSHHNSQRLVTMLQRHNGQIWLPDFNRPLEVQLDPGIVAAVPVLRLRTDHGDLNVVNRPAGLPGGYPELAGRADTRTVGGAPVQVASTTDLIRAALALGRDKDRTVLSSLRALQQLTERERPHIPALDESPEPATAAPVDSFHAALDASGQLAVVFDEIRPAVAAARRQLRLALDDAMYDGPSELLGRRVAIACRATTHALEELALLRAQLQPGLTQADLGEPPASIGNQHLTPNLAYQAEEKMITTLQTFADIARSGARKEVQRLLTEARLHVGAADGRLDLLEIDLERQARGLCRTGADRAKQADVDLGRD